MLQLCTPPATFNRLCFSDLNGTLTDNTTRALSFLDQAESSLSKLAPLQYRQLTSLVCFDSLKERKLNPVYI